MLQDITPTVMIPTARPEASRRFFEAVLGLPALADNGFAVEFQAGAARLFLQRLERHTPRPGTIVGWSVPDLRAAQAALAARGVVFERFEGMEQDAQGVWIPPGGKGMVCWFKDPDGNLLSLSQT